MARGLDRAPPLPGPAPARGAGLVPGEEPLEAPPGEELLRRPPHPLSESRERGGAERRGLHDVRTRNGDAEQVGLELHQEVVRRGAAVDRKSTRLNSSHQIISYAVFCLKK